MQHCFICRLTASNVGVGSAPIEYKYKSAVYRLCAEQVQGVNCRLQKDSKNCMKIALNHRLKMSELFKQKKTQVPQI